MPGDHVPSVPINKPSFDWSSINLSQEFATFKQQVLSLILLKSVTKDTSLNQCLEFALCVEGNMQSEELSKKMGDIMLDPQSVKVDAIKHKKAKRSQTPHRARNQSESSDDESHKSKIKCLKCGMKHAKRKCPAFGRVFSVW